MLPALTRRRYPECQDCWHIYCGDIHVGTISRRSGCPVDVDQWSWHCGFYPGMEPGQARNGTAASFSRARISFRTAWKQMSPILTEAAFEEWRDHRDVAAWNHAMQAAKMKLPTESPGGLSQCFCGTRINICSLEQHVRYAHRGMGFKIEIDQGMITHTGR
jgi:hypothetical protein